MSPRLKCTIVTTHCPSTVRPSSLTFYIFEFSSETTQQNSTKLDRKQDLNVLYQVLCFWADRKNKMAAPASDWLRHFRLLLWNHWNGIQQIFTGSKISTSSSKFVFFSDRSENKMATPASDWRRHFLLLWNHWTEFNETWQEARSQRPVPSLCFSGRSEQLDDRPALWSATQGNIGLKQVPISLKIFFSRTTVWIEN